MSYGQQNPYAQGPAYEQPSHGCRQANPYAQDNNYELQDYGNSQYQQQPQQPQHPHSSSLSQQDFLDRIQTLRNEIKSLTNDIDYIGQLHQRSLSTTTDPQARDQLEHYVSQTQVRNTAIKDGIKGLERDLIRTTDGSRNTKNTQLQSLKTFFKAELDKYHSIERDYQNRYRDQIARQYRIVNPDASDDEIRQATEADWSNEGVFQTALRTNRTGHATSLLGNVRARHNELQQIEQTIAELGLLYQDLAAMVEEQDPGINANEENAENVVTNIEKGNEQILVAQDHASRVRRLKWWLLLVIVIIIIIIVLVVTLVVTRRK